MTDPHQSHTASVLLFDGECGLCHRVVRGLLRLDREGLLRFAPLQGLHAQEYLKMHRLPDHDFETLVFVPDWSSREQPDFQLRTAGALAALRTTGRFGRVAAGVMRIVPRAMADGAYRIVGHWRHRFFGPWRPKPLARAEWAGRFLE